MPGGLTLSFAMHLVNNIVTNSDICTVKFLLFTDVTSFSAISTKCRPRQLLLACLMGHYCFARWRLPTVVVVCNAAGVWAGRPPTAHAQGLK